MVELKTPGEIDAMRAAGAVVADALAATSRASRPRPTQGWCACPSTTPSCTESPPVGDVSAAIGHIARGAGYGLHTDFGGHGVGRTMHESPHIPNDGRLGRGLTLRAGLTIAIEPWFTAGGTDGYRIDDDGWTLRSADGSRGAHFEHTIARHFVRGFWEVLAEHPGGRVLRRVDG